MHPITLGNFSNPYQPLQQFTLVHRTPNTIGNIPRPMSNHTEHKHCDKLISKINESLLIHFHTFCPSQ